MTHDAPVKIPLRLTEAQRATVCSVLDRVIPGAEVWVFGSRATGRARPFSDLDLLLTTPDTLDWTQRADLRDAFETSDLPFRVEVVEARSLTDGMRGRVEAERVRLHRPER